MPIGVPKVPFRLPGEEEAVWIDVYNRLYRERLLFLGQNVDDEIANQLIGIMMYLNGEDETKDMYMYINSPGGECIMEAEEVLKLRDCITRVYVQRTGKPVWVISEDMERDVFMSAKEAQTYGIVDLVAVDADSTRKRRNRILAITSGSRGTHSRLFRTANQQSIKTLVCSHRDRGRRKRDFRRLWISRINATARTKGISYSRLMQSLYNNKILLNRKMLAQIAILDNDCFNTILSTIS
eukprot:SM000464S16932  [mRNA]  locus=s464:7271:9309:- [translate_table: standard]